MTFQSLFDIALQDYEKQTGLKLIDHPHAKDLELCNSVEAITAFFQDRAFRREDGNIMKPLKRISHVLYTLSVSATLGEGFGLVCPEASVIVLSPLRLLNSHSHPRKQYSQVSPSCSLYVLLSPTLLCVYFRLV
jgi:hypothetical protein